AFYSFRIIFLAFHGKFRGTHAQEHHLHESPKTMTIPLIILAVGAVSAGWIGIPELLGGNNAIGHFFEPVLGHPKISASHNEELQVMAMSVVIAILGITFSWFFYMFKPIIPKLLAYWFKNIYKTLWNKYYIDEIYEYVFVKPTFWISRSVLIAVTDSKIIEGVVNGVPKKIHDLGEFLRKLQTGHLQHYGIGMALGLFTVLTIVLILSK
ncbi:MAG: NADH-quinone oxidoreductase subunit L, partial [Thermodesulfovibrionales bacterium]|nr:NADH-quinone oxidoreductase subunit L [Thermodesulfovibrionales bacterium]